MTMKAYAKLPDPTKADFTLHCCGVETQYWYSAEHSLSHEGGYLECRKCGRKYRPTIKITLKEVTE